MCLGKQSPALINVVPIRILGSVDQTHIELPTVGDQGPEVFTAKLDTLDTILASKMSKTICTEVQRPFNNPSGTELKKCIQGIAFDCDLALLFNLVSVRVSL